MDDPETDAEREALLKEVADLASWDAVRKPDQVVRKVSDGGSGLTGHDLLERARRRILACNDGKPPRLLDPFAGGGAIPLEALRLGCEVEASDLNPVAVLILKGTVEYPQKYGRPLAEQRDQVAHGERSSIAGENGQVPEYVREAGRKSGSVFGEEDAATTYEKNPLAADVRYWGNWMLERAREELAEFYPPDPDGSVPIAYLWSRTVPCPNCKAEMPLIRQYWLARRENKKDPTKDKKVALQPVIDLANRQVDFEVVEGQNVMGAPAEATTSRGDTLCLICRQVVKVEYVREQARAGLLGAALTSVILEARGGGGKRYRADNDTDRNAVQEADRRLAWLLTAESDGLPPLPDEPIDPTTLGLRIDALGFENWGQLFGPRQAVAMIVFSQLVQVAYGALISSGTDPGYAEAVASYLALTVDRVVVRNSNQCIYHAGRETIENEIMTGRLPPVWDSVEGVRDYLR